MTAYLKGDHVARGAGPFLNAYRVNAVITSDGARGRRALAGSPNWLKYSVVVDVPKLSDSIETGVMIQGGGTVWIDDLQVEPVTGAATR